MIIKEYDETQFDEYVGSYTTEVPDFIDDSSSLEEFINGIQSYVEGEFLSIYITDTQYDKATGKLTFVFEDDNNMPITNLESIYDSFDAAIEYATEDYLDSCKECVTEDVNDGLNGSYTANIPEAIITNRLEDALDVFINEYLNEYETGVYIINSEYDTDNETVTYEYESEETADEVESESYIEGIIDQAINDFVADRGLMVY